MLFNVMADAFFIEQSNKIKYIPYIKHAFYLFSDSYPKLIFLFLPAD